MVDGGWWMVGSRCQSRFFVRAVTQSRNRVLMISMPTCTHSIYSICLLPLCMVGMEERKSGKVEGWKGGCEDARMRGCDSVVARGVGRWMIPLTTYYARSRAARGRMTVIGINDIGMGIGMGIGNRQ